MNRIPSKYEVYQENAFFVFVLLFVSTFLFKSSINSFFIILLTLSFFFKLNLKSYFLSVIKQKITLVFAGFYLITVLSYLNSENHAASIKEMVLKLPFLIFPVILGSIDWTYFRIRVVLIWFVSVVFLVSLYCFFYTYFHIFKPDLFDMNAIMAHDWAYFSFILPNAIDIHPVYFSLFLATSLLIIYFLVKNNNLYNPWKAFIPGFILSFYFLAYMALLSSRTSLFALLFVFVAWVTMDLWNKGYAKFILIFWFLILILFGGLYLNFPYFRGKLDNFSGVSTRSQIWTSAYQVIRDNFIFGTGTGDVKENLRAAYRAEGFQEGLNETYNAHNQYIQTTVALGVIGLFALLSVFWRIARDSIDNYNMLALSFLCFFSICCLTEALLSRQHGVAAFCFFTCFFPLIAQREKRTVIPDK